MRATTRVLALAMVACALAAAVPGGAVAQQTPPPKSNTKPPQPDAAPDDLFLPPMRGTPDGRISGGTRGVEHHAGATGTPAARIPPAGSGQTANGSSP